ncbi:MAG: phosphate transport system substrate-binding protein, partial [Acetobacteraceae bacterium]|nr:phosphate transport system substrate-binding protein [Acetobacteraceae bacterium]
MSGLWVRRCASAIRASRRMPVVWIGPLLLAAALAAGCGLAASAQEKPASFTLRIGVADSGRGIFDDFIPDIAATSQSGTPPEVKYATALGTLRDFCQGIGGTSPDIVLTTRRLRSSMVAECGKNGVEHIAQVELGRTALVLAVRSGSALTGLAARQVYLALARDVPDKDEFRRNTAIRWSDTDRSLPQLDIRFQLPPREDPARSLFNTLILEGGCRDEPVVKLIFSAEQRTARCMTTRVDRIREIPRDQAVRALLDAPEGTVGVVSHQDIEQSDGKLVGVAVDGIAPDHDAIMQGTYEYSNMYYLYAKRGQALRGGSRAMDSAIDHIIARALTEPVIGPDGIL